MEDINRVHIIFTTFLAAAAWQDLRNKSVSVRLDDRRCDRNWRWLVFRGQRALLKLL